MTRRADGSFRTDVWARLSRWVIEVPPLRERLEDVPLMALAFAERYAKRPVTLSPELVVGLLRYPWPGNVRELAGTMERLVISAGADAPLPLERWLSRIFAAQLPPAPPTKRRRTPTKRPSDEALAAALDTHEGNVHAIARELGVSRKTVYRWLEAAGLDPAAARGS